MLRRFSELRGKTVHYTFDQCRQLLARYVARNIRGEAAAELRMSAINESEIFTTEEQMI